MFVLFWLLFPKDHSTSFDPHEDFHYLANQNRVEYVLKTLKRLKMLKKAFLVSKPDEL